MPKPYKKVQILNNPGFSSVRFHLLCCFRSIEEALPIEFFITNDIAPMINYQAVRSNPPLPGEHPDT